MLHIVWAVYLILHSGSFSDNQSRYTAHENYNVQYIIPGCTPLRWKKTLGLLDKVGSIAVYMFASMPVLPIK